MAQANIEQSFTMLLRKVGLSLPDYMEITKHQSEIEALLSRYIQRFSTAIIGPFAQKTLVSPLSDNVIEILVLFNITKRNDFYPDELAHKLAMTLESEFDAVDYEQSTSRLKVGFEHFTFDVRPGFLMDNGCYIIPSDNNRDWIEYHALNYSNSFIDMDCRQGGRLKHIVMLLKVWNHENSRLFDDYYLEILVQELMQHHSIETYAKTLRSVFAAGTKEVMFKKEDPANRSIMVEGLHSIEAIDEAAFLFRRSFSLTDQACEKEQAGDLKAATELWMSLYPVSFPTIMDRRIDKVRDSGKKGAEALRKLMEKGSIS